MNGSINPVLVESTKIHPAGHAKVHVRQRPSATHGDVLTYSPEVREHANFLLNSEGEAAMKQYLEEVRNGGTQMESPQVNGVPANGTPREIIGAGSLENALKDWQDKSKFYRSEIQRCQLELARCEKVVEGLQQSLGIATATRKQLVEVSATAATAGISELRPGQVERRVRTNWRPIIEDILFHSLEQFTKSRLIEKLRNLRQVEYQTAYCAVNSALQSGWLSIDGAGIMRLKAAEKQEAVGA